MRKHVILTNGRSGSNYLAHTLNLHPNIVNYGEVLGSWTVLWKIYSFLKFFGLKEMSMMRHIYSSRLVFVLAQIYSAISHWYKGIPINWKPYKNILSIGIKEFFIHFENRTGLQYILDDKNIDVIYLSRSDLVRRYVSMLHMEKTKIVVNRGTSPPRKKIYVDIPDMLRTLAIMQAEVDYEKAWIKQIANSGHRIFEIRYEEYFVSDTSIKMINENLFEFLGVTSIEVRNTHRKILSGSFFELIENYDEFLRALENSVYSGSLE